MSDLEDAVGTPRETSAKLDHTLQAYGRLERRHYEVKRENRALRDALNVTDEMVERACAVLEDAGYEDTGRIDREAVRDALQAALSACASPNDA